MKYCLFLCMKLILKMNLNIRSRLKVIVKYVYFVKFLEVVIPNLNLSK